MRVRILGPLEVQRDGAWHRVGAAKWRALIAALVVDAGRPVSLDRLAEELWPAGPPRGAVNQLHGYVMRVRRALDDSAGELLQTRPGGYELVVAAGELDVAAFEELADSGVAALREGKAEKASARLTEALDLWRGPAYADVPATHTVQAEASRLEERRLTALEARIDADLQLARHAELTAELRALVDANPLRERFWEQLMLALYRSGRQSDALQAYQDAYHLLDAELGVEPGRSLQDLHGRILAADPGLEPPAGAAAAHGGPPAAVQLPIPRQLPPNASHFSGRQLELTHLDNLLSTTDSSFPTVVISGPGGAGKTTLAVHWARRVADKFPDGQLYADLLGYASVPDLGALDVLARFLRSLGVPNEQLPADVGEAAGLFRSLLADRRMLIVLDNAGSTGQVRPLLCGSPHTLTIVTSRDQLAGLSLREAVVRLDIGGLDVEESLDLLTDILGKRRFGRDRKQAEDLADQCGHLPLALRIAAAQLAVDPSRSLADYVAELRAGNRLDVLALDDTAGANDTAGTPQPPELTDAPAPSSEPDELTASLRLTFDLSYRRLDADSRRLFRLLGLVPGEDFDAATAAALAGTDLPSTQRILRGLASRSMLTPQPSARFRLHDLLRLYAADQCLADDDPVQREAATTRLLDHYLGTTVVAVRQLASDSIRLPATEQAAIDVPTFDGTAAAAEWLDTETGNLVAATRLAHDQLRPQAWLLADALRGYFFTHRRPVEWLRVAELGLETATNANDIAGQAAAALCAAQANRCVDAYDRAHAHAVTAEAHARAIAWKEGQAVALNEQAIVWFEQGRMAEGAEPLERAIEVMRSAGHREAEAGLLVNLGVVRRQLGDVRRSAELLEECLALLGESGSPLRRGTTLCNLGETYRLLGEPDLARQRLETALDIQQQIGHRSGLLVTTANLAMLEGGRGNATAALEQIDTALNGTREIGSTRLEAAVLVARGDIEVQLGRPERALHDYRKAAALAEETGSRYVWTECQIAMSKAHVRVDDAEQAVGTARTAREAARTAGHLLLEGMAATALAHAYAAAGRRQAAHETAEAALAIHRRTGHRPGEDATVRLLADLTAE